MGPDYDMVVGAYEGDGTVAVTVGSTAAAQPLQPYLSLANTSNDRNVPDAVQVKYTIKIKSLIRTFPQSSSRMKHLHL